MPCLACLLTHPLGLNNHIAKHEVPGSSRGFKGRPSTEVLHGEGEDVCGEVLAAVGLVEAAHLLRPYNRDVEFGRRVNAQKRKDPETVCPDLRDVRPSLCLPRAYPHLHLKLLSR